MAEASGITVLRTAYHAPRQHATCEPFLGGVRRECPDHILVLSEGHLRRIVHESVAYFDGARAHQGLRQHTPADTGAAVPRPSSVGSIRTIPVLGGLHHTFRRAA